MSNDPEGKLDKSPGWEERHVNPSGLPDIGMLVHEHEGQRTHLRKVAPPIPAEHHEEGHTS